MEISPNLSPDDSLDASAILQKVREGQDRPLADFDDARLESARERAREDGDQASLRMVEEEQALRKQDSPPPSSTAVQKGSRQPSARQPTGDPNAPSPEPAPDLNADSILTSLRQQQEGDAEKGEATDQEGVSDRGAEQRFEKRREEGALESMLEYASAPVRGATEMTASIIEGAPVVPAPMQRSGAAAEATSKTSPQVKRARETQEEQRRRIEETLEGENGFAETAEAVRRFADERLPKVSREERDTFVMRTLEGLGSTVPFLVGGAASGAAGGTALSLPVMSTIGVAGSEGELIGQARRERQRAKEEGEAPDAAASAEEVQEGADLAAVAGASEALPLASALSRAVPAPVKRKAMEAVLGGLEEASQETFGTVTRNLAAREFDPTRDPLQGVGQAAETGGAVGFLLNAITTLAGGRRAGSLGPPGTQNQRGEEATDPAGPSTETQQGAPDAGAPDAASILEEVRGEEPDQGQAEGEQSEADPASGETPMVETQEEVEDRQDARLVEGQEARARTGPDRGPREQLFETLRAATPRQLAAIQQSTGSDAVREEVQQSRVVQQGDDPATAVPLPDVDPQNIDVPGEIREAVRAVEREERTRRGPEARGPEAREPEAVPEDQRPESAPDQAPDQAEEAGAQEAVAQEAEEAVQDPEEERPSSAEAEAEDADGELAVEVTPEEAREMATERLAEIGDEAVASDNVQQEQVVLDELQRRREAAAEEESSERAETETESSTVEVAPEEAQEMSVEELARVGEEAAAANNDQQEQVVLDELQRRREAAAEKEPASEEAPTLEQATGERSAQVPTTEAQPAREAITGLPRDEKAILEEVATTSQDPAEIALAYRQARKVEGTREQANDLKRAIEARAPYNTEQYEGEVGSNIQRDEDAVRLRMLSSEGKDLDQAAQEISSELGREVSVQELVDTIREVGQGTPDARTTADRLAQRFEEVTGQRITKRQADQAIEQAIEEEGSQPQQTEDVPSAPNEKTEPVTAPFQRTRRLSEIAQLRRQRGERLFRGEVADGERIQPRPDRTSEEVGTFREMLEDLQERTDVEIHRSQLPRAAAGMYEASGGATIVRTPNDVDTAIHEVAHALDDRYGVLAEWNGEESSPLDEELIPQFSRHGSGAAGQETGAGPESPTYERAEGFAEWLRAFAVNPQAARERAPQTFERYQEQVPDDVREAVRDFGERLRNYAAAAEEGDPRATLANVETDLGPPGVMESLKSRFDFLFEDRGVGDTWMDRLATEVWDEMRIVMKVWDTAQAMKGRDLSELDVDENFRVLARLFNGLDTRVMRYFESGLEDMQGNTVTEGGFDRILEPLDTSSRQQLEQDLGDGIAFLVNQRVIERATTIREDAAAVRQNHEMAEELRDELDSVESRLETARERRDKARRQESYRSDQFEGEEVIDSLRRRRDALRAVVRNLRRETKRAERHLRTARRKRDNARSALRRAEKRWEGHREDMETVTDWERNEDKTKELRSEIERQQERFDKWQEKAMALEQTRDDLRAQLDDAQGELETARGQIEQERSHQRRLESAEERIERYEKEVEALSSTRDALREDLQEAEDRISEAKGRLEYNGRPSGVTDWASSRVERLAGTGGGIFSDEEVAQRYLERLEEDPDRADRLQQFARRYREWADALLQRLRDAGILSQEQIDGIRERNQHYAAFNRVDGQEEAFVMDNVDSEAAQSVGGLASSDQVIHRFKGSTRTMQNPLVSLVGQTHAVVTETERNQMLQAFVNPFRSDRAMYEGEVMDLGRIARKATSEDKRTIEVKVQGETEYWQLHPELYKTMKNLDGVEQQSGFIRMIQQGIRFSRNLITYSPPFVTRQLFRDPQEVAIKSESGFKPWENLTYLTDQESREQFTEDVAKLESAGGAQFGWHARGREGYYEQLRSTIEELSEDSGTVITSFQNFLDTYKRLVEKSEIASRVGDFERRYEELLESGTDEYDARRKAGYETRNLMDFAQGGRAIKQLNRFVPFLNAAVQGMRTAVRAGRDNPPGLAFRFLKYGLMAEVGAYVWNTLVGGDDALERWRQEPAYLKDFFYTFHIPGAEWMTVRIPKTYEFGLLSSLVVRSAEKGLAMATEGERGDPNAMSGASRSAKTAFMPLDPAAVASSPGLSLLNVQSNWDPFRQRHIVSPYESKLDLDLREGDQHASRLGQGLQSVGMKTLGRRFAMDARKWDYLIQSLGGGSGRLLTTASDIGRTDQAGREFWMDASGLFVHPPVYGSRDVQFVLDWAERRGETSLDAIERLEDQVSAVYEAEDAATRRARAQELWDYARQLRAEIESRNDQ